MPSVTRRRSVRSLIIGPYIGEASARAVAGVVCWRALTFLAHRDAETHVVVRKEPAPRDASPVIIREAPDQSLDVGLSQCQMSVHVGGLELEFFEIVPSLVVLPRAPHGRPALHHGGAFQGHVRHHALDHGRVLALLRFLPRAELEVGRRPRGLAVALVPAALLLQQHGLVLLALLEDVRLGGPDDAQERLEPVRVADLAGVGQVLAGPPPRPLCPPRVEQERERPVADVQGRHVREEIVPDEERHEDEIVDDAFQIVRGGIETVGEFQLEIFAQNGQMKELKVSLFGEFFHLLQRIVVATEPAVKIDDLAQQGEVRFVRHEAEHDEIRVLPVHAVPRVGPVPRLIPHVPNVLHDLVLPLPRHLGAGEDDVEAPPQGVLLDLFPNEVADVAGDAEEELRAGGDAVGVERPRVRIGSGGVGGGGGHEAGARLSRRLGQVLRGAEAARALLVQLRAGRDPVDGHVDGHLGPHDLRDDAIEI